MNWLLATALFLTVTHSPLAPAQPEEKSSNREPRASSSQLPRKLPPKKISRQVSAEEPEPDAEDRSQDKTRQRVRLDSSNVIQLNYGYPAWNLSPTQIDSASMLMREGSTGRIVQIHLQETAPDSSVFSGLYSINWKNIDKLQVEFYVPPQEHLGSPEGMRKIMTMINSKKLRRHPFILRRSPDGMQSVVVFDTREQAVAAVKAYRVEQQVQLLQNKKVPSDQEVDTAALAEEMKQREAAARSLAERVRLGQVEARRLQDLNQQFYALTPGERVARQKEAEQLAQEGLELYRAGNFNDAQSKFDRAVTLDPTSRLYYFQFGVTLYRNSLHNRSIVYLELAEGNSVNETEKRYYVGLNYYALKELDNATAAFDTVAAANDPDMSPSAKFYKGIIYLEQKNWDAAQAAFQEVLDTSRDPRLDQQAETYIEQILRLRQYEAERGKKWTLAATIGEMYDSNVLLSSDSSRDTGTASDTEGYRTLVMSSFRYRPVYEPTREFAAQLDLLTMYSVDSNFQTAQSLRNADPTMATLTLPWTYKGLLFGKGYKFDITPGYETIFMSIENNENKSILNSYILNFSNLFVMNNFWFATYNLDIRKDDSQLESSIGDSDSTALKVKLSNSNLIFLSDDKSKIVTAEVGYTLNQAQGRNATYNRTDFGVGYIQPWKWETSTNLKLSYFYLDYSEKLARRVDNSYTVSAGLSKKLSDIWSLGSLASYNINNSNTDSSQYKKWTVMMTLSGAWNL